VSSFFKKKIKEKKKDADKAVLDNSPITTEELEALLDEAAAAVPVVTETVETLVDLPVVAPVVKPIAPPAMHLAHNVYFDSIKRKFMLVTIQYDTTMQQVKIVSVDPFADDVSVATKKIVDKFALKLMRGTERV